MLDFNKCQDVVVEWNRIGDGGKNDITKKALVLQRKFCEEEWNEFQEAIASKDGKSILKELSDCIVVFSYHDYLCGCISTYDFFDVAISGLYTTLQYEVLYEYKEDFNTLLTEAFDAVMESNYSKFPFISEIESPSQECKDIEERSNGRYTGITFKIVEDNEGNKRYVFKDSNGKIVKPKTYKEPVL